jgi:hypothetical protein
MAEMNVQYGCGLSAPEGWLNFDSSPTLRVQRMPLVGAFLRGRLGVAFPPAVRYGDIVKGLPVRDASCDAVYCSHVLEHLALEDCRMALAHTFRILKPGGVFRCVLPDLERAARNYVAALDQGDVTAGVRFMGRNTLVGMEQRPKGVKGAIQHHFGNSLHLWMWDEAGLRDALLKAGFTEVRRCGFNDSANKAFLAVEDPSRYNGALGVHPASLGYLVAEVIAPFCHFRKCE